MSAALELSVVVPVHRNAETLEELVRRVRGVLIEHAPAFEMILVDDACPAGSWQKILEIAKHESRLRGLSLSENVGQHTALLVGLSEARGHWCLMMDGDLQDPPEAIPSLLAARDENTTVVFGARHGDYEPRGRLFTSRLFKRVQHWLCGVPVDAGLFVALRRDIVEELISMPGPRPSIVAMIGCSGRPHRTVPVERAAREHGQSSYRGWSRLRSGLRAIAYILKWRLGITRKTDLEGYGGLIRSRCASSAPATPLRRDVRPPGNLGAAPHERSA